MGINQWVGAWISLYKVILAIFHQISAYYLQKSQIFKKCEKLLISSLKSSFHRCCLFLSSLWCSAKSTSFLKGEGEGVWGSNHTNFDIFKSRILALPKIGTILLFHCISKGFLFLQNWLRKYNCTTPRITQKETLFRLFVNLRFLQIISWNLVKYC